MSNIVKLFVNREKQTAGFIKMMEGGTPKRVMIIEAGGGLGKSWAIEYMREECQRRKVPNVEVDFADGVIYDFLAVLRRARDSFGASAFNAFTQTINQVTQPTLRIENVGSSSSNITLGEANNLAGANVTVGDVAGGNIIKDNSFVINADSAVVRQALQDRLTVAFFECLEQLTAQGPVCFFFDTYDKVTIEAESWLLTQLLPRLRERQLTNVVVVIAGRSAPKLDNAWDSIIARTGLDLFKVEHATEYLVQRCGLKDEASVINALFQASTGLPQLLAMLAENILRSQDTGGQDDWL
ncbi:MAG: hypothetical protein H0T53_13650 [Herpetosiphonaceae bacterium]|nr:hypothetical protein [Herpetosiphonaceae bacterium]